MWLVEIPAVLQISHDAADGGSAQRFLEALGDGARRDRLSRFNVGPNYVGQNLSVSAFLESGVSHRSAPKGALTTIVETLSRLVKACGDAAPSLAVSALHVAARLHPSRAVIR
jgi:hypothetical protein